MPAAAERSADSQGQRDPADAPSGNFSAVSAGGSHTCGLRESGEIECWGGNGSGQADAPDSSFSAVSAGYVHSCGLRTNGEIECWGQNGYGQNDAPGGSFSAVSVGFAHTCGLRTSGEIECWGDDGSGQADAPAGRFSAVSAGGEHACAIRESGEIECWGRDDEGQTDVLELRFGGDPFVAVSAGGEHACGLSETGAISCWGRTGIPAGAGPGGSVYPFVAVGAGVWNTCAVRAPRHFAPDGGPPTEGELVCWGNNEFGQAAPPTGSYSAVSAGWSHACGLRTNGEIKCWGANESGQFPPAPDQQERYHQPDQQERFWPSDAGERGYYDQQGRWVPGDLPPRITRTEPVDIGAVEGKPQFSAPPEMMIEQGADYRAIIELENGSIEIDLFEQAAPIHVNNFIFLVEQRFYDGLTFHRVVPDFVAQAGDPTATGTGGAGYTLPDEAPNDALTLDARGVISMARSGAGASSSQFFITLEPAGWLDAQRFTAFGRVTEGIELLDAFEERDPAARPPDPAGPRIVSITIER